MSMELRMSTNLRGILVMSKYLREVGTHLHVIKCLHIVSWYKDKHRTSVFYTCVTQW